MGSEAKSEMKEMGESDGFRAPGEVGGAWLLRLRWLVAGGQAAVLAYLAREGAAPAPLAAWAVPAAVAASNAVAHALLRRERPPRALPATLLALDTALLTVLLAATGGVLNPFTILYLVHIALSALVLSAAATWGVALLAIAGFAALFLLTPSDTAPPSGSFASAHHGSPLRSHLQGMWVAFVVAALATALFVTVLRRALERREREVRELRAARERALRQASLSTFVGGAAHELATPLGSIGVLVGEIERGLAGSAAGGGVTADLEALRGELGRCREILDEMAAGAGESVGERFEELADDALAEAALARLDARERERIDWRAGASARTARVPPRAAARAVQNLLRNALEASPAGARVELSTDGGTERELRIRVLDRGAGFSGQTLPRATEPFFTTKPEGDGLGLGLYLTRSLAEQLGGGLELAPRPGGGAIVELRLLRDPVRAGSAAP